MADMELAVARIVKALREREKICIWGDYDVDGVTATSVLYLFLKHIGLVVDYYIPSRLSEGYGLNTQAIDRIVSNGIKLLITVDCGISDVRQVDHAHRHGLEVLILDHHQIPDVLPKAVGILNPHREDCGFPAKNMAAVGVAFNLIVALRQDLRKRGMFLKNSEPNLREMLDLVALGTVADIVPLLDENRIITHFGLSELSAGRRPGIAALKEVAGLLGNRVTAGQVAFRLAPRINAVGRLSSAVHGVKLMTTRSYSCALELARELDRTNTKRQEIEQRMFQEATIQAQKVIEKDKRRSIVLASDEWHVGVVGIVASRLVEKFSCPVVLIGWDGSQGRGSARSVEGLHLYNAMEACQRFLVTYGGHRLAAGLTIEREHFDAFADAFEQQIQQQQTHQRSLPTVRADALVQPSLWTIDMVASLERLEPFGLKNPEPRFVAQNVEVRGVRAVGKESLNHVKAVVKDNSSSLDAIGFRMADRLHEFRERLDLLYTPNLNLWDGHTSIQLRLVDIRPVSSS